MMNEQESTDKRTEWAEDRTDWAEDRTLMANERTFAAWMRTGMAAVGIGLGFHALFGKLEPWWLPRAIATTFVIIGIFIFYRAQQHGCSVFERLDSHAAKPLQGMNLRVVAVAMSVASAALVAGIWMMDLNANGAG